MLSSLASQPVDSPDQSSSRSTFRFSQAMQLEYRQRSLAAGHWSSREPSYKLCRTIWVHRIPQARLQIPLHKLAFQLCYRVAKWSADERWQDPRSVDPITSKLEPVQTDGHRLQKQPKQLHSRSRTPLKPCGHAASATNSDYIGLSTVCGRRSSAGLLQDYLEILRA